DSPDWPAFERVETTLNPTDWWPRMATNDAAQWGMAAIQNLHLVGDFVPDE
ncbi:MAG: hypothetical protein HOQ43_11800, partial [Glycomyces artemisiae]|nr:hypothetical protein [Glycomyces artemisiae]